MSSVQGATVRWVVLVGVGSLVLAACGSQPAAQQQSTLPANFATIAATPSGQTATIEVQSYQHGQLLLQRGANLTLETPLGVSTRAGIVFAPPATSAAPEFAAEVAHGTWPNSVFYGGVHGGSWLPQDVMVAVAPFPGSVVTSGSGGVAIVGTRSFGAADQSIVRLGPTGAISGTVVPERALAAAARRVGCGDPEYRALGPSATYALATCGTSSSLVVYDIATGHARAIDLGGPVLGTSGVVASQRGSLLAAVLGGHEEHLVVVALPTGLVIAQGGLGQAASATPSVAADGSQVAVLVPQGSSGMLELIGPVAPGAGSRVRSVAAPTWAQGVGFLPDGTIEVVAANPNANGVGVLALEGGHWRRVTSASIPVVTQG
jgi:hypothetical protein